MVIKKAKYKKVRVWQTKEISPEQHGCDNCKTPILDPNQDVNRLEVKVFWNSNRDTDTRHFCSWECVLEYLPKIKSDYFVDLPFVHFDGKGNTIKDLLKVLKKINIKQLTNG